MMIAFTVPLEMAEATKFLTEMPQPDMYSIL
jgi:hypothetical protein